MSETVIKIKKKEKKKTFNYEKAVAILKPMIVKWSQLEEDVARKLHEFYMMPEFSFIRLCELLKVSKSTVYRLFDEYSLPRKYENISQSNIEQPRGQILRQSDAESDFEIEVSDAEYEDEITTEFDTAKYQETYSILDKASHLSKNQFAVVEKKELIKKLQSTIAKLNGLLVELESDIE